MAPSHGNRKVKASRLMCWAAYVSAAAVSWYTLKNIDSITADLIRPLLGALAENAYVAAVINDSSWSGLLTSVAATTTVFVFSFITGNTSVYDPYWCYFPMGLSAYWLFNSATPAAAVTPPPTGAWLAVALTWVWGLRFIIFCPWMGWTQGVEFEDWRYELVRNKVEAVPVIGKLIYWPCSFMNFHLFPTVLVFGGFLPIQRQFVNSSSTEIVSSPAVIASVIVTLGGVALNFVADRQMDAFVAQAKQRAGSCSNTKKKESMRSGLWAYSRHPNYVGECCFWTGQMLLAVNTGAVDPTSKMWLGCAGIWAFFRFAAVPMMDDRSLERRPDTYPQVMAEVSPLMLWPSKEQ